MYWAEFNVGLNSYFIDAFDLSQYGIPYLIFKIIDLKYSRASAWEPSLFR